MISASVLWNTLWFRWNWFTILGLLCIAFFHSVQASQWIENIRVLRIPKDCHWEWTEGLSPSPSFSCFQVPGPDIWLWDNTEAVSRKPFCSRDLAVELSPNAFKKKERKKYIYIKCQFQTNPKICGAPVHLVMLLEIWMYTKGANRLWKVDA